MIHFLSVTNFTFAFKLHFVNVNKFYSTIKPYTSKLIYFSIHNYYLLLKISF